MKLFLFGLTDVSIEVYFILFILGVPVYFFWRWIFKLLFHKNKNGKVAVWVATLATTPLIYTGIICIWIFSMSYHPTHDFTKERWDADHENRYELSGDIIESKMLIGKTKSEVREILGNENNADQNDYWNYYLGSEPGFMKIDPEILDIEFKDGKVIKVSHHES